MDNVQLHKIKLLITEQTGLRILDNNEASFGRLIRLRMEAFKLISIADYYHLLLSFNLNELAAEHEKLYAGLTTGETFFFRDHGQIDLLSQQILPELIARNRAQRRLKIWSAGCSSGEEPYTLAILLDELNEDLSSWQILILGTDIDADALTRAKESRYGEWSFRQVSEQRKQRYFQLVGTKWALKPAIQKSVQFRQLNLVTEPFPTVVGDMNQMDLILCRNVFIYLESEIVAQIADKMAATLVDGGYLMTGHGELYARQVEGLCSRVFPHSIVYQKAKMANCQAPQVAVMPSIQPLPDVSNRSKNEWPTSAITQTEVIKPLAQVVQEITIDDAYHFANQGQPAQASAYCDRLILQNPMDYQPYYLLALLAQEQGCREEAKGLLKKVIYLAPDFISAYLALAEIYAEENKQELAQKMWSSALNLLQQLPPDTPIEKFGNATSADILEYVSKKCEALHDLS